MKLFRRLIGAFIFPVLVLTLHVFLYLLGIYESYTWMDIPMHFLGGFSAAFTYMFLIDILRHENLMGKMHFLVYFIFVISLVSLTAVLWEFFEFSLDMLFEAYNQKGLGDTLGDILIGLIGGIVGFFFHPNARR